MANSGPDPGNQQVLPRSPQGDVMTLQGMKLLTQPRRKSTASPDVPCPSRGFDFLHGHSLATMMPSFLFLFFYFPPLHQEPRLLLHEYVIPGTSCYFRAMATEPHSNAKIAGKEKKKTKTNFH